MLAAKLPCKETIRVVEEPVPVPGKGEVLIKMKASALCRSDLHRYHGVTIFDEDEKAANITPVSYTHLDVYKRQKGYCVLCLETRTKGR